MSTLEHPTIPFPPREECKSLGCDDRPCCPGQKHEWPELVGMKAVDAKPIIEKENPFVTAVISLKKIYRINDLCCNIVWIYVDDLQNGVITMPPVVG